MCLPGVLYAKHLVALRLFLAYCRRTTGDGNDSKCHVLPRWRDGLPRALTRRPYRKICSGRTAWKAYIMTPRKKRRSAAQHKRSKALRRSDTRFRQMADHAPVIIWIAGTDKSCTWVNTSWLAFTGRSIKEELGNGWTDRIHSEDLERCLKTYETSFASRVPFTMEYRVQRHDGQWRWLIDSGVPLYEDGKFTGYLGSCIDVTDRKQSEQALQERKGLLDAVLGTVPDAIITIDRHGTIVAANPATTRIFGYTNEEILGQNIELLMPHTYLPTYGGYIGQHLEIGNTPFPGIDHEVFGARKDGSRFPIDLAVSEIPHLDLFTGIIRDITARKQTEQELDQYRKDLRTMSSELMLAEQRERQRLAEDLHDGVGQALFRARMKLDQLSTAVPAAREVSAILAEVAAMMNTMTFQLSPPVLHKLGLRPALRSLAKDMRQRYALSVQINDDGQDIPLDEPVALILFRSIRELLINVSKHAQTESAVLSIKRRDHRLQVEVSDRGKGFETVDQSCHVDSGHFGLFSIHERIEYIGGTFKIRSMPGQGTTVTLTAPLTAQKASGTRVLRKAR
jgi:PAS domain S-box-containing protein